MEELPLMFFLNLQRFSVMCDVYVQCISVFGCVCVLAFCFLKAVYVLSNYRKDVF